MRSPEKLLKSLDSLVIFRHLLDDELICSIKKLFNCIYRANSDSAIEAYGAFAAVLYAKGGCITDCIVNLVFEDDNIYVRRKAATGVIPSYMDDCLSFELGVFSELASLSPEDIADKIPFDGFLPKWEVKPHDLKSDYKNRTNNLSKYGYGIYAKYSSFIVKDSNLLPVKYPDKISLDDLKDYENERQLIIDNTQCLVNGGPAQNVLLIGDAGTGKSSTVKATANHFAPMGLRLVQITKNQLHDLPVLLDELSSNPLKFIVFIDDLSFSGNDDDFGALKAALEGSVSAKSSNTAIYVTSNRRHLVKEDFNDRNGGELHMNDTIQEITSLSDRFGLTVTYVRPDKKIYLDIVCALADSCGLEYDRDELCFGAEVFATRKGGRSPRCAKQYIDSVIAKYKK